MITDQKLLDKIVAIENRYKKLKFETVAEVPVKMCETLEHFRKEPDKNSKLKWKPALRGMKWGGIWVTAWFCGDIKLPVNCINKKVFVCAKTDTETLFIVDGEYRGVFDKHHPFVLMESKGNKNKKYHISLEAYAGSIGTEDIMWGPDDEWEPPKKNSKTFDGVFVCTECEDVSAFVYDIMVLRQLANNLNKNSLRLGKILRGLAQVFAIIDAMPSEKPENVWRPKLKEARKIMKPLLDKKNSETTPEIGIIGHSHIDTAWLWPLSETWRKSARTFSSILNLMEQYPEFKFIQSAPCHTEKILEEYPSIFKKIKKRIAEGRWEPNGAMWVEPDCNLSSGESFIRQLLFGQKFTQKHFSYTADTLWLPDVFGYSAALPQILKSCNVNFFCTTKLAWNDTNRFPYDTFNWKGIDGTSIISHLNDIHCWPDPQTLIYKWNNVQHKDIQDRHLLAFGFGDGGGGPQCEMIEVARRVKNLEGCPKTKMTTVSDFMKGVSKEMKELPEWSGELYLELHRGTLTSMAKIKRGNRKLEAALREAEFLNVMASLKGAKYPTNELRKLWNILLVNQFHDILPGSSIKPVNVEAVADYEKAIAGTLALSKKALEKIAGQSTKNADSVMLVNSLSWNRKNEVILENIPAGLVPANDEIQSQSFSNTQNQKMLAIQVTEIPALGSKILKLKKGKSKTQSEIFKVSAQKIITPHAKIRFNKFGQITSLIDKNSNREIVKKSGVLNSLLIGEDVPKLWDNWDIDKDQEQKMEAEKRLIKCEIVSNGSVQLRIRSKYKLGLKSTLTQDLVFHASTPQIDFETKVDWNEKHTFLKAGFDFDILADTARHEIQFGHLERPTHQNHPQDSARFEVCTHKWTDISEGKFGVAILNDCKYGISLNGSSMQLSLLKSGTHPDETGDNGVHFFTYSILPHACGFSVESVIRPAYELNNPVYSTLSSSGTSEINSLVKVDAVNVIVESIKPAEEISDNIIIRLYEAGKSGTHVKLTFDKIVKSIYETNMLEEKKIKLKLKNNSVSFFIKPFEIKSLKLEI